MQKSKLRGISLFLIIAILIATLTSCINPYGNLGAAQFDSYCNELVYYMLQGDALSVNFLLSEPETFGLENSTATLYKPIMDKDQYYKSYSAYGALQNDLNRFNYSALSNSQKATWQMLMNSFADTAKKKNFYYFQSGYLGSVSGTNCNLPVELAEFKFNKKLDIENYLSLLEQSKDAFKSYTDYEKIRIDNGYGRADVIYQGIVEQCNGFAPIGKDNENFLVESFNKKVDASAFLTGPEKIEYKTKNLELLKTKLLPAYRTAATTVATFVGNASNNSLGLAKYEDGADYYQVIFNSKTSTADTVEQAHANLAGFYNKTLNTYFELRNTYDTKFGLDNLDNDIEKLYENQATDKEALQEIMSTLKDAIKDDFPTLPDTVPAATFNFVDESLADFYSPAAYFLSTADSMSSPEVIYVNNYSDSDYITFELLSHEGYPGHLLQNAYFKSTGAHPVRRLFGFTGYAEGWGNYAQFYTAKYFSDKENLSLAYQLYLTNKILSGVRVSLVDILVNGYGNTVKDIETFLTQSGLAISGETLTEYANSLVDFVVENPANYPAYYYGYYKLISLKNKYQQVWGSLYTDLAFHQAYLSAGPMSFEQLEAIMFA